MTTQISSATDSPVSSVDTRALIATVGEFRDRLLSLVADLDDRQLIGPRLAIVNPPLWEIGHVAWTQEFWVLRHVYGEQTDFERGDRLYNSTDVAHDTRWELLLPNRDNTLRYMNEVLELVLPADSISTCAGRILFFLAHHLPRRHACRSPRLHASNTRLRATETRRSSILRGHRH